MKQAPPNPEIAVVMAVRNGAPFLQAAIDSILRQDFAAFEFLIEDDGSTDETVAILDRQTDARLRVLHRHPSGSPASLNFAVAEGRAGLKSNLASDGLHLNNLGYQKLAEVLRVHLVDGKLLRRRPPVF